MTDIYTPEKRSQIMSGIKNRDTGPERLVRSALHRLGFRFRLSHRDLPGKPDVVITRAKVAVFVNGCYWHSHHCKKGISRSRTNAEFWYKKISDNVRRDARVREDLERLGWRVVTIWECQTRDLHELTQSMREAMNA